MRKTQRTAHRRLVNSSRFQALSGLIVAAILLSNPRAAAGSTADPNGSSAGTFRFGEYRHTISGLQRPLAAAITADGTILIAEAGAARIRRFAADGSPLGALGVRSVEEPTLLEPADLTIGPGGRLFVVDAALHRVVVLAADGTRVRSWGEFGRGLGQFNEPRGIAVDEQRVYVADLGNDRVQVFDHEGNLDRVFGDRGVAHGAFNRPAGVALDGEGHVYIADSDNNRVQKFDHRSRFVDAWGDYGPFSGLLDQPSGVVCHAGEMFVADRRNHRVQVFDLQGELRRQWGVHAIELREGEGKIHYPRDLAIAPDGSFAVICEPFENRCQVFASLPAGESPDESPPPLVDTRAHFGERITIEGDLLAIAEPEMHRIHVFDVTGDIPIVIGTFGERGRGFGLLLRIAGLKLDYEDRSLFVGDTATRRLQRYDVQYDPAAPRGFDKHRVSFGKAYDLARLGQLRQANEPEWVIEPAAIVRSDDGELFVVDPRNHRVVVFDESMSVVRSIGAYGEDEGEFRRPTDLAISPDGATLYVVDAHNCRVQAFDRSGRFRFSWGGRGPGEGDFLEPFGITTVADGSVFVTDAAAHRVQQFRPDGNFVRSFGEPGTDQGSLWKPRDIERDHRGWLHVVDYGNHRVQIFTPAGEWLVTYGTGRAYMNRELLTELREEEQ